MLIGVGKDSGSKFKKMEFLDGTEDENGNVSLIDRKGNKAHRDIVQFVPFRKNRDDYKKYANELLEELAEQIKEYMQERDIYPNNELVRERLR